MKTVERFTYQAPSLTRAEDQQQFLSLGLPLYDTVFIDATRPSRVESVHIGRVILVHGLTPPMRNERSSLRIRSDGVDQIIVSCILEGQSIMEIEGRRRVVEPRQVQFFDLSRVAAHEGRGAPSINLVIPRDMFEDVLFDLSPLHGLVLGSLNDMIVQHLQTLAEHAPDIPQASASGVAAATVAMLAAAVRASPSMAGTLAPAAPAATMRAAREYVLGNLARAGLTPALLTLELGISRTKLYAAFAPFGGVSNYIRDSRLRAVRRAMLDPGERRKVGEIAFAFGFKSEAHFNRAFRDLFGIPPNALRRHLRGRQDSEVNPNGETIRRWLED